MDLDGDGFVDAGAVVSSFTGISTLTLSYRGRGWDVNVYFTADVDTAGTSSTTDDVESFLRMRVLLGPSAADPSFPVASGPAATLEPARPNPFRDRTEIRFSLAGASATRLAIYDVTGRRIALLADQVFPRGLGEVAWNGTDGRGRAVHSGIYFVRFETERVVQSRKLMLLK